MRAWRDRFFYERGPASAHSRGRKSPARKRRPVQIEALETRLLLSADVLPFALELSGEANDVTLRLEDVLRDLSGTPTPVEMLQLIDDSNGAVLAEQARDASSEIIVTAEAPI